MDVNVNTLREYYEKAQETIKEAYSLNQEDPFLEHCYGKACLEFEDEWSHKACEYKSPEALIIICYVEQITEYLEG